MHSGLYRKLCVIGPIYTQQPKANIPGPIGDKNDTVRKTRDG